MSATRYHGPMLGGFDRRDARNAIAGFLFAYGWVSFFCFFPLVLSWAAAAPHAPDPTRGLIYPHNEHGSITYFSAFQGTSCALLFGTSPLLCMLGIAVSPKRDSVSRTRPLSFSMEWKPDDPRKVQRVGAILGAAAAPVVIFFLGPSLVVCLNSMGIVTGF